MQVLRIEALFTYPVKSLAGLPVTTLALDDFGPSGDRRWMIVDEEGHFVTQRSRPELALIATTVTQGTVAIEVPGHPSMTLVPGQRVRRVKVWGDWVDAVVAESGPAEAISQHCGAPLQLVYMPDTTFRRVDPGRVRDDRRVGFADGFPFLVVNQQSLDDLNRRLDHPVDIRRFRPNIVVSGAPAWDEDEWRELQIGGLAFDLVKPCSRCIMTTVDPDTGINSAGAQPLRTLGQFRRTLDGVIFGMNAVHRGEGSLASGDQVVVVGRS
ncbi:MOSC domain-containing protein [Marinobacter sp. X15-166B]|uniref:MOSC domain-containing protein n=1 Tax=Marinobacter sp. X15-166B TaxID=1897620 RepID=UPI00085C0DD7|nr:MOSC N-terminal beta barrel domain-containing protein [Marinobacter sp. X15-166B]OEY67387.1 molybdenum cofactor sulfurase [Marinobacter sp. X15-166B]